MKVAVIGAGAAGLCAAHYLSANSSSRISFAVFEQTGNIGGTWVYNESTGLDEFGLPIHSSMYKNLRTNLPKETMEFLTFKFNHEKSFVPRADVLKYLKDFVDCYQLKKYIKFYHHVTKVSPKKDLNWEVSVKNLKTNEIKMSYFDAVMVCNGHYSQPRFPEIPGMDKFKERQIHSHDYREPEHFCGKNVVIIGSGPSGVDITFDIAPFTKNVYFSHHNAQLLSQTFPENVIHKPDVVSLTENGVIFQDGTSENVDAVVYCTGYHYQFPFLTEECRISVEDNFVQPLYKQLINIHHPSMCFIGIPWQSLIFPLFDLQVRCFINVLLNKAKVPSSEEMLLSLKADTDERKQKGQMRRYYHKLGNIGSTVYEYMDNLATTFNATPIPQVVHNIYESARQRKKECLHGYREDLFQVIDDHNYICHPNKGS